MEIQADEISSILKKQIKDFGKTVEVSETGTVLSVGDGIARIYGLEKVMAGELVEFSHGIRGIVLNLEEDNVGVAIMGHDTEIREGDEVRQWQRLDAGHHPAAYRESRGCNRGKYEKRSERP